jgi:hypothetical protein
VLESDAMPAFVEDIDMVVLNVAAEGGQRRCEHQDVLDHCRDRNAHVT